MITQYENFLRFDNKALNDNAEVGQEKTLNPGGQTSVHSETKWEIFQEIVL